VYDPFDGIWSYFKDQFYEGAIRIKNGIAAKMSESEILDNIREDRIKRIYGEEEEPWLAFLLRFALPIKHNHHERFREIPNPLTVAEHEGERWTHVMIDEAQDLCVAEAALLSSFVHPDGAFTVAADFRQVVSPVWGMEEPGAFKIGSSLRDKESYLSYPFAKNMRQSKQIGLFLQSFYQSIFREFPPFECNENIEGPAPLLMLGRANEFPAKIKQRMTVMNRNPNINSIALLQINEDEKAMIQIRSVLEKHGLEIAPMWASADESNRLITTSVERIKGLEYDACFVIGMDDIENSTLNYSKNRAYVALSRPAFQLTILCEELPPSLQKVDKNLIKIIKI
jgi:DNA helicase IV